MTFANVGGAEYLFIELTEAAALILALGLMYRFVIRKWPSEGAISKVISGLLFGFICIIGMEVPVVVEPGVIFDARSIVVTLSGVFGGPIVAGIATLIAGSYRAWLGGGGALVGVGVIIASAIAGLSYRILINRRVLKINGLTLLCLGAVVHIAEVCLFLLLPKEVVPVVFDGVVPPLLMTFIPATALLGLVFHSIKQEAVTQEILRNTEIARFQALNQVVYALSAALEARDTYTAGHGRSVASIAILIAKNLGLDQNRIDGLELAATIHDVGKIQVSSQILGKPGRLTDDEMDLMKLHPEIGAGFVRGIAFDWPIAQMVLQHHERMDGSGYPNGLEGEEILLEARILAVADTVDAVASDRPYRKGRGLGAAKAILKRDAGKLFDPDVCVICIELIDQGLIPTSHSNHI